MAGSDYYDHSTFPSQGAAGSSAAMRSELELIEAGFGKLPTLAGNGGKIAVINAGGTAMEASSTPVLGTATATSINGVSITAVAAAVLTLANGSTLATSGAYSVTLTSTAATNVTLPTTGTLATRAGAETLTNKTADLSNNTLTGTKAQFNTALSDGDFAFQSDIQAQAYTAFTTAGTSTAYTLTPSPAITAYAAGQSFFVTFNAASGAAPTLAISGLATPPNLVKENADGTYSNIAAGDIPINHRSRVTLISATQALVERVPTVGISSYSSGNQTITTGGALTLAHGLTKEPRICILWLKCLAAENGYSIGDKILTNGEHSRVDGSPIGTGVLVNTTNIVIRYSSSATCFSAVNAATGTVTNLTNASWALVVEAFA